MSTSYDSERLLRAFLSSLMAAGRFSSRTVDHRIKDPIEEFVVEALLCMGPSNVTEIAGFVRNAKGSSSRQTVRQRLGWLREKRIVVSEEDEATYSLSREFLQRWWSFLKPKYSAENDGLISSVEERG